MTRYVPFESNYDTVRKFEKLAFICLLLSSILIAIIWLFNMYNSFCKTWIENSKEYLKILSYISMIGYIALSIISKYLFYLAEKIKKDDIIDNSFGSSYSEENSKSYYNNEEIPHGVKKLAVNCYESSYHTEQTLKKMLFKNSLKILLLSIPFILSIFTESGFNVVRLLFEISMPVIMISQLFILIVYFSGVRSINNRFMIELTNIGNKEIGVKDNSNLLIPVMDYFNLKSWATTNLDSKIFNKHNDQISSNWLRRKEKLKL